MRKGKTGWNPDFIGIGAMKAATYWFYNCLDAHPEICMGSMKEVHFFDRRPNYQNGIGWYESFFSHCDHSKKQGEITPGYLCSSDAASLIHKHYPDVKLFACLRNPVDRAYSHYRFNVIRKGNMGIYEGFEQAIEKEESLVEMGLYCKQLKPYYDLFPKENILILLYDDIVENPSDLLCSLYSFIGVDSTFVPPMVQTRKGVTGIKAMEYKIPFINPLMFRIRDRIRGGVLDNVLGKLGIKHWLQRVALNNRRLVDVKDGQGPKFPPLDHDTCKRLAPLFSQDVKGLEELLGRDLSAWM